MKARENEPERERERERIINGDVNDGGKSVSPRWRQISDEGKLATLQ